MNSDKSAVYDDFYMLSEMLDDDIELICDMMHLNCRVPCVRGVGTGTKCTIKRSRIKSYIENGQYMKIRREIDMLLSMEISAFRNAKVNAKLWRKKMEAGNSTQTTIFDYL